MLAPAVSPQSPQRSAARPPGSSPTSDAFDASVSFVTEGRSLFFVVGRAGAPDGAVLSNGGVIAARLSDPRHVLAVAPLASQAALRNHPAVAHAGPVSLDPQRFAHFAQLMGLDRR
jgi:hypothetical protein